MFTAYKSQQTFSALPVSIEMFHLNIQALLKQSLKRREYRPVHYQGINTPISQKHHQKK